MAINKIAIVAGSKADISYDSGGSNKYQCKDVIVIPYNEHHMAILVNKKADAKVSGNLPNKVSFRDLNMRYLEVDYSDYHLFVVPVQPLKITRVRSFKLRKSYVVFDDSQVLNHKVTIRFRGKDYQVISHQVQLGMYISEDSIDPNSKVVYRFYSDEPIFLSESNYNTLKANNAVTGYSKKGKTVIQPRDFSEKPNQKYELNTKDLNNSPFNLGFIFGEDFSTRIKQSCMDCVKTTISKPLNFIVPLRYLEARGFTPEFLVEYVDMVKEMGLPVTIQFVEEFKMPGIKESYGENISNEVRFLQDPEETKVIFTITDATRAGINYLSVILLRYLWWHTMGKTANIALQLFKEGQAPLEAFINANKKTGYLNSWNFISRDLPHNRGVDIKKYLENVNKYYSGSHNFSNFLDIIQQS